MQSGRGKVKNWRLEFDLSAARGIEPLMGWTSATDMRQEVAMNFASCESATAYCEQNGIEYQVREPKKRKVWVRGYADNFRLTACAVLARTQFNQYLGARSSAG